jgi:hypothetical protein
MSSGAADRRSISVFNGAAPSTAIVADEDEEAETVGRWVAERIADGIEPHEIGVFVCSPARSSRAGRLRSNSATR